MNAKRFLLVSASILLLVIAYSVGASKVQSQTPSSRVVGITSFQTYNLQIGQVIHVAVVTENGDVYWRNGTSTAPWPGLPWEAAGNIFGGTVQVEGKSWGAVKDAFRK